MRERHQIVGDLKNLDRLVHAGDPATGIHGDRDSDERDNQISVKLSLAQAFKEMKLEPFDVDLLELIGNGHSEASAAEVLGVHQTTVHSHVWALARRIQCVWRTGRDETRAAGRPRKKVDKTPHQIPPRLAMINRRVSTADPRRTNLRPRKCS